MKKLIILFFVFISVRGFSQENYLGEGPFNQLIIRSTLR